MHLPLPRRLHGRAPIVVVAAAALVAVLFSTPPTSASAADPGEPRVEMTPALQLTIQGMLEGFVSEHDIVGMSAAVVTPRRDSAEPVVTTFAVGFSSLDPASRFPVDSATQFELGSESKAFTADLLAFLVAAGRVSLDDPVRMYAPAGYTVPPYVDPTTRATTEITLRDLATHQSGLPDLPPNHLAHCGGVPPCDDWRSHYTQAQLWDAVQNQPPLWQPGTTWLYSNFGFGLLGTILANVIDPTVPFTDPPAYQAALDSAFLTDLGMSATMLEQQTPALATPYFCDPTTTTTTPPITTRDCTHVALPWDNTNALAGGGGLISDAADMATWVAAHLGYVSSSAPLGVRTLADTLRPVSDISEVCTYTPTTTPPPIVDCDAAAFRMGLAWQLYGPRDQNVGVEWAFKDGGTNGSSTDTVLAPTARTGVTTLFDQKRGDDGSIAPQILALLIANRVPDPAGGGRSELADSGADAVGLAVSALAAGLSLSLGGILVTLRRRDAGESHSHGAPAHSARRGGSPSSSSWVRSVESPRAGG